MTDAVCINKTNQQCMCVPCTLLASFHIIGRFQKKKNTLCAGWRFLTPFGQKFHMRWSFLKISSHAPTPQIADSYHSCVHFFQQLTCFMLRPQLLIKNHNSLTGYYFCIQVDHFSPCDRSDDISIPSVSALPTFIDYKAKRLKWLMFMYKSIPIFDPCEICD